MRSPLRAAALVAAVLSVSAGAATARPVRAGASGAPRFAFFTVSAVGSQRTTWRESTRSGGDCTGTFSITPMGSETVRFSAPAVRMVAMSEGPIVMFHFGNWNPYDFTLGGWRARGSSTRRDDTRRTSGSGTCGASSPGPAPSEDCGRRSRVWNVNLQYLPYRQRLELGFIGIVSMSPKPGAAPFATCPVETPPAVMADTITTVAPSFPRADLFGGFAKQIVLGSRTWRTRVGGLTATTTVRWTITLVRHGGH